MVDAVQQADAGIYRAVEVQVFHRLTQENRPLLALRQFLLEGLGQHLGGKVHTDDLIVPLGQQEGHGTRATGQVQDGVDGLLLPGKEGLDKVRPGRVVHIPGHVVVAGRQRVISEFHTTHSLFFSSSQKASILGRMVWYPSAPYWRQRLTRLMVALLAPVCSRISL